MQSCKLQVVVFALQRHLLQLHDLHIQTQDFCYLKATNVLGSNLLVSKVLLVWSLHVLCVDFLWVPSSNAEVRSSLYPSCCFANAHIFLLGAYKLNMKYIFSHLSVCKFEWTSVHQTLRGNLLLRNVFQCPTLTVEKLQGFSFHVQWGKAPSSYGLFKKWPI